VTLTIEQYDELEREQTRFLSFTEIMAFSTATFDQAGFPARISDERELLRYVDWNFDLGNQDYFRPGIFMRAVSLQTVFTSDEAVLLNRLCDHVAQLTGKIAGRSVRPLCNPLAQMGLFRIICALHEMYGSPELSVFEVGPGSGYLGALLAMNGYRYGSVDNAQALYLWQNRLLASLVGQEFSEWASPTNKSATPVMHLPWWEYVRMYDHMPMSADVVVSNANLGEMSGRALLYTIAFAQKLLADSRIGLFIYASEGDMRQNSAGTIEAALKAGGFERVFQRMFNGWVLRNKKVRKGLLEREIPLYNPSRGEERAAVVDFLFLPPDQHPLDLEFTRILNHWVPPVATSEGGINARYRGSAFPKGVC
jgi:hypothetical protein